MYTKVHQVGNSSLDESESRYFVEACDRMKRLTTLIIVPNTSIRVLNKWESSNLIVLILLVQSSITIYLSRKSVKTNLALLAAPKNA